MGSGRTARVLAFGIAALLCVAAGVWLAPRVRSGGSAAPNVTAVAEAYRPEAGTALLEVLPPSASEGVDAAWQRAIQTHAARVADPSLIARVLRSRGAVAKTRWATKEGTPADAGAVAAVRRALAVRTVPGTALIAVRVDVEPKAEAVVLTNALCDEYLGRSRQASRDPWEARLQALYRLQEESEKQREEIFASARRLAPQFGGDPQLVRARVSAAEARLRRLEEALADVRGARPPTAPEDARPADELAKQTKAAADDLAKAADQLADLQAHHARADELADRMRLFRQQVEDVSRDMELNQAGVRLALPASADP